MKKVLFSIFGILLLGTNLAFAVPQSTLSTWAENYKIEQAITDIQNNLQYSNQRDDQNRIDLLNYIAKRFQDSANAFKTGTTIPATVSTCQKISQTLWDQQPTATNENIKKDVTLLQAFLSKQGLYKGTDINNFNGYWNRYVGAAVSDFQAKNGLVQTGAVGPKTLAKINSMICATNYTKCISYEIFETQPRKYSEGETIDRCSLHTTPVNGVGCTPPRPGEKETFTCANGNWQ